MNYKFYIYKQDNLVNFDKYDLTEYSLLREITQNSKWGLKIERDREWFTVIRRTFSGEITVKGADFDALIATEGDTKQYALVIHRECSGVYTEFWKGYFSYFDFKVNLDTCYLTFEPTVWDKYTPIYDQLDIERNVLVAEPYQTVLFQSYEFEHQTVINTYFSWLVAFPLASWVEYSTIPIVPNEFYMYSQTSQYIGQDYITGTKFYTITQVFKRDIGYTNSDLPGGGPTPDPEWVLLGEKQDQPGVFMWVRPYLGLHAATYTHELLGESVYEVINAPAGTFEGLTGCITLKSVLEYFATFFDLTYESDFFNDSPCPMGGNSLDITMIQQISNLRDTVDVATKGMMKLKDLLTWIKDTFNVYWYIDAAGDWRLEHRKYFDYGLSYTYTHVIELNISTLYPSNISHLNKYEWNKPELCRFEKLEFPYSYFPDWENANIEYPQLSIMGNETKTYSVEWGTDILAMWDGKSELSKQGWVLLDCWQDILIKKVTVTIGAISGTGFTNARFSQANLMRDLWGWGRILPTGNVNGASTTFGSIEKLRKQVTLSIPQCCQDLDYNGLFRTELGDGLLDSAEYEQNGTLKLNLIYE